MAGYGINNSVALGCGTLKWYYSPNYSPELQPGSTLATINVAPVFITVTAGQPDRITLMYSTDAERAVAGTITQFIPPPAIAAVAVDGTAGYTNGDLVMLVNQAAAGCTLARATVNALSSRLLFNADPFNPPNWGLFPTTYGVNDTVFNLGMPVIRSFSIANAKLRSSDVILAATGVAPQDLVDGIVDLRAQYGKDTDGDGTVETWNTTAPANSTQWQQVLALRVAVLARIGNYEKPTIPGGDCDATTAAPLWSGGGFGAVDIATVTSQDRCYRYRMFETTIPLRNMIWRPS
jgi:type IV pilus assembly protein PilW